MTINQGLKSLASDSPNFNNNEVSKLIADTNIGLATISYTLAKAIDDDTVLTASQKTNLKNTINNKPYLNIGRIFQDLDIHTEKILTGELGEEIVTGTSFDYNEKNTGTFLEHMQIADSIENLITSLFDYTAESIGKGVDDHFGTLRLSIKPNMNTLRDGLTFITNASLATDTAYQTACTNLLNFINSIDDDSTDFQQTLDTFADAVSTAETNLDTALSSEPYLTFKTNMISARDTINNQITKEISNIGSIRTYAKDLANIQGYTGLANNNKLNEIIRNCTPQTSWQTYFSNYTTLQTEFNPIYTYRGDSTNDVIIEDVLRLEGLPDVTDYLDIRAVAEKLLKDIRLKSVISNVGKTSTQLIALACQQLDINVVGKDVYAQSKLLLNNMNNNDVEIIKQKLQTSQAIDTLD